MDGSPDRRDAQLDRVQRFLVREARLLDERRWSEWLDLFEPAGRYWVPMAWGQTSYEDHVSLIAEDVDLLRARTDRAEHKRTTAQWPPSRTLRQVGNVEIEDGAGPGGDLRIRSALTFVEYRRNEQRLFAGRVTHVLAPRETSYGIRLKRVDLLNCDAETGHLRIALPF